MERPGFGEKQIMGPVKGRKPWLQRKARESGTRRDMQKEDTTLKPWAGKKKGADIHEFLEPVGFKYWRSFGLDVIET